MRSIDSSIWTIDPQLSQYLGMGRGAGAVWGNLFGMWVLPGKKSTGADSLWGSGFSWTSFAFSFINVNISICSLTSTAFPLLWASLALSGFSSAFKMTDRTRVPFSADLGQRWLHLLLPVQVQDLYLKDKIILLEWIHNQWVQSRLYFYNFIFKS